MRKFAQIVFYLSAAVLLAGVMMFAIAGIASADGVSKDMLQKQTLQKESACYDLSAEILHRLRDRKEVFGGIENETLRLAEVYHHYCKR